jgi:hypothetical protein
MPMPDAPSPPAPGVSRLAGGFALVWAGCLAGVSLLATPVKFSAPSLELAVALDVGRVTFAALNRLEIVLAALLILIVVVRARAAWNVAGALLLAALVGAQALWLLPGLDARVQVIMDGGTPPDSPLHWLYIGVEGVKLVLLAALGVANLMRQRGFSSGSSSS